ncbi:MAG: serine/threonine protein kinase [Planctomycetota bacterium]
MKVGETIRVNDYTFSIVRKIAEGGMGAVYEANQNGALGFKKRMAIKTILADLGSDPEYEEMFIGEAKLAANLIHPNIVQLYHLGKVDEAGRKMRYMALELVDGITLYDFMKRHRERNQQVPYEISAFIASRICRALDYAHTKTDDDGRQLGIVHRDCTPKNIMIDRRGVVKLTDFGAAKARHFLKNQEGQILVGKIAYMSPEQAAFKQTDGRTDVFSLGIVLWECVTAKNLFDEGDTRVGLEAVQSKKVENPSKYTANMPKMLEDIILKALQRPLEKRYKNAAEMGKELESYLYHDRFGVNDDTLNRYLKRVFPEIYGTAV